MNAQKSIQILLQDNQISAEQFLSTPNIASQIRLHLTRFVKYCKSHKIFTVRMIQLAFDIDYQQLQEPLIKQASKAAIDVFGNQETQIVEMFFQPLPKNKSQADPSEIKEQIAENIQSEAERLFKFDQEETVPQVEVREEEITRQEIVSLSLQILKHPQRNQTCLGHLQKMYSFFIRHEPLPVLAFFDSHPQQLELLLASMAQSSSSTLLAQLLTSEDKSKEYKFQSLKKQILEKVVDQMFKNLDEQLFFQGTLVFVDQILNATKQSYFQYFQDFKRISNYLVSTPVLTRFFDELMTANQTSFCSVVSFLQLLFNRINSEGEDNRYYHRQQNQVTMNFQIDIFVKNVGKIIALTQQIQPFSNMVKIRFFSFVEILLNTKQAKNTPLPLSHPAILILLEAYKSHPNGGVCKNKIYHVLKELLTRSAPQQLNSFISEHSDIYSRYFSTLKAANYSNTKNYNKNENSGFDISLIASLTHKEEAVVAQASKAVGKDMKRICKKFDTKIASFQNNNTFSLQEESSFHQYGVSFNFTQGQNNKSQGSGFNLTIGKNNISIPVLHLPDRYHNSQSEKENTQEENSNNMSPELSPEVSPDNSPTEVRTSPNKQLMVLSKEVIEEQQVVSLTNNLKANGLINLTEVIAEKMDEKKEKITSSVPANSPQLPQKQEENSEQSVQKLSQKIDKEKGMKPVTVPSLKLPLKVQVKVGEQLGDPERARFFTRHLAIFA